MRHSHLLRKFHEATKRAQEMMLGALAYLYLLVKPALQMVATAGVGGKRWKKIGCEQFAARAAEE